MFEHFTFGAQSLYHHEEDEAASPTNTSFAAINPPPTRVEDSFPEIPSEIHDIMKQLSNHNLKPHYEDRIAHPSIWGAEDTFASPTFYENLFTEDELTYVSTTRGTGRLNTYPQLSHQDQTAPCRRLQRQINTQIMQSCEKHVKDIKGLVENMIESNSQCNLRKSPSRLSYPSHIRSDSVALGSRIETLVVVQTHDWRCPKLTGVETDSDEGFAEIDETFAAPEEAISLRRASVPSGIKKSSGERSASKLKGADGFAMGEGGKKGSQVRCLPRMRKRKGVP